jgi:uncharacterized protein
VMNPDVLRLALSIFGPDRILYGTDNPILYMRGRQQWRGSTYVNRTSHPFHFNREREPPETEAQYTLYLYEALRALRQACDKLALGPEAVEKIFSRNAERLVGSVLTRTG